MTCSFARMTPHKCTKGIAGTYFNKHCLVILQELPKPIGKSYRSPQMPRPVFGRSCLFTGNPSASNIRNIRNCRLMQINRVKLLDEWLHHRLHHGRMKCMRGMQPRNSFTLLHQQFFQFLDVLNCSGYHAQRRPIDRSYGQALMQQRSQILLRQPHTEHRACGSAVHQLPPCDDQPQSILKRHHPGEASRHIFAYTMPNHRAWLKSPAH
ncbi:hypothetical protein D3C77_253070 [compost metagenome]